MVEPQLECGENATVCMTSTTICGMALGHKTAGIVEGVGSAGSKL